MAYIDKRTTRSIIDGYAWMVYEKKLHGWSPFLVTFMFKPMTGSPQSVDDRMRSEVIRVYGQMLTRVIRNPAKVHESELPFWIACPDYPVYKRERQRLVNVAINDGLHVHAIACIPSISRIAAEDIEAHVVDYANLYYANPQSDIANLDWRSIDSGIFQTTDYALKGLKSPRVDPDMITVLPRTHLEMPTRAGNMSQLQRPHKLL